MIAKFYAFILIISVIIAGCNVTRNVKDGEHLLIKNSIALNKEESGVQKLNFSTDELPSILQQKPNKNFLGFLRVGLWVNSVTGKGKETGFKRWLNKNFGQEPIIFDPFLVDRSVDQLQLYLDNHGFFNSTIQTTLKKKGKKARVYYHIALSKPYRINEINYNIEDTALRRIVFGNLKGSLMKRDQIYKSSTLDDERYRIKSLLRNEGYYYFTPDYIFYKVDSALNSHQMNLELNIQQVEIASDTNALLTKKRNHQKFYLNNIFINPDFNPLKTDASNMETFINPNPDKGINRYVFYYRDKLRIRPRAIRSSIFLEPLKKYREKGEKNTYKQLSGFPLFGYTSLEFRQVTNKSNIPDSTRNYLNCSINLTRRPVQSFSLETEGTTSSGKLGMAGNFVYQNLNIFRGGEVFTVKLTGGFEWQSGGGTGNDVFLFFNTFETGAEASLDFPKFLAPVSQDKMPKMLRPRTTIKTGISYQNRPDYERYISNISFGYNWRAKEFISHSLIPIEVNSVSIFPDTAFIKKIDALNDPRLKNQYTDHFIMALKYNYIFNNQERNKVENFIFFRWNFESAGNALGLVNALGNTSKNEDGKYTVWSIPYAQYLRSDVDFRYYFALDEENTLVYRNLFGLGIPYGNSVVLPFEKGFYAGGASDMRGWQYRSLGPGSYKDTSGVYFEKMGDLILEANLEYRFPVYSFLKGALFADFGNIWLLNHSESFPGGRFEFKDILSEMAIDAGIGFRLDFNFFIFRIDGAAPIRNPAYPAGNRWRISSLNLTDVIWNFGIGYPF